MLYLKTTTSESARWTQFIIEALQLLIELQGLDSFN